MKKEIYVGAVMFLIGIIGGCLYCKHYYENEISENMEKEIEERVDHQVRRIKKAAAKKAYEDAKNNYTSSEAWRETYSSKCNCCAPEPRKPYPIPKEEFEKDNGYEKIDIFYDEISKSFCDIDGAGFPDYEYVGQFILTEDGWPDCKDIFYIRDEKSMADYKIEQLKESHDITNTTKEEAIE